MSLAAPTRSAVATLDKKLPAVRFMVLACTISEGVFRERETGHPLTGMPAF